LAFYYVKKTKIFSVWFLGRFFKDIITPRMKTQIIGTIEARNLLPPFFENTDISSPRFEEALKDVIWGTDFITAVIGPGGCGKSVLLKIAARYFGQYSMCIAPTGVAANNLNDPTPLTPLTIGATTIHKAFGIKEVESLRYFQMPMDNPNVIKMLARKEVILIDEISMVRPETLDMVLHQVYRASQVKGSLIRVICFGDPLQLPPVYKNGEEVRFFFDSYHWKTFKPKVHVLDSIYRQSDGSFRQILNRIRMGEADDDCMDFLRSRVSRSIPEGALVLDPRRDGVTARNNQCLTSVSGNKRFTYVPEITERGETKGKPDDFQKEKDAEILELLECPPAITLYEGQRVMCTKNIMGKGVVNGSMGTVTILKEKGVGVLLDGKEKREVFIEPCRYELCETSDRPKISAMQIPLCSAYAVTYHKAQGLSLDNAYLVTDTLFSGPSGAGMFYIGVSRVRTPEGLFLSEVPDRSRIRANPRCVEFVKEAEERA
jgi:ATP-dependent exoDNAse (exonuclease V) alpha subunit